MGTWNDFNVRLKSTIQLILRMWSKTVTTKLHCIRAGLCCRQCLLSQSQFELKYRISNSIFLPRCPSILFLQYHLLSAVRWCLGVIEEIASCCSSAYSVSIWKTVVQDVVRHMVHFQNRKSVQKQLRSFQTAHFWSTTEANNQCDYHINNTKNLLKRKEQRNEKNPISEW